MAKSKSALNQRTVRNQSPIKESPFNEWTFPDGTLWAQFFRTETGYLIRFPGLADFTMSGNGKEIAAFQAVGVSDQTVDHLQINQIQPLAHSLQWNLVLHAAAIEIDGFAVAFLGLSGRGKSTLAASFATNGFRFLTDDGLQLLSNAKGHFVEPSHPSIRLWDDSRKALIPITTRAAPKIDYSSKLRLLADDVVAYCDVTRPLRCLYFLGEGNTDSITFDVVQGRDAMIELVRHSFLLDTKAPQMLMRHFDQLAKLAGELQFFQLDYPRRFDLLPSVREAIVRHATSPSRSK